MGAINLNAFLAPCNPLSQRNPDQQSETSAKASFAMPPRRSSRTRASVEPPAAPSTKRKRPLHDANQVNDTDTDVKATVKATRGSRASRRVLEDVKESEEEQEDTDSPPVKKSRPSLENESVAPESDEEQDPKPTRPRRSAGKKETAGPSVPTRGGRRAVKQEVEEEIIASSSSEEEEVVKPRSSGRRAAKRVDQSSDEEFVETKPVRGGRNGSASRGGAARGRRGKSSAPARPSSTKSKRAASVVSAVDSEAAAGAGEDGEESDTLSYAEPKANPSTVSRARTTPTAPVIAEEDEEEGSLLEPEVARSPTPKPQVQPVAHIEPQGPTSRLVIHKMVLVNFKSYAGRQEIGPFHKVSHHLITSKRTAQYPKVILLNRRTKWLREIEHYRRPLVRIRIPRVQDATGKVIRTHPQFRSLSRP